MAGNPWDFGSYEKEIINKQPKKAKVIDFSKAKEIEAEKKKNEEKI
ncbi:hypothetical protein [Clostridium sp. C2-6-12]|nr:hypothetical protein [Clostridium sp. C2-6-12]